MYNRLKINNEIYYLNNYIIYIINNDKFRRKDTRLRASAIRLIYIISLRQKELKLIDKMINTQYLKERLFNE